MPWAETMPGRTSRPRCRFASSTDSAKAGARRRARCSFTPAAAATTATAEPSACPLDSDPWHAPATGAPELGLGERQGSVFGHQLVDRRSDAVVDERVHSDVGVRDRHPTGVGDRASRSSEGRRAVEEQQSTDAATHRTLLEFGRRDDAERDTVADVEQCRIRTDVERPVGRLDHRREVTDIPCRDPASLVDRRRCGDRLRRAGESVP